MVSLSVAVPVTVSLGAASSVAETVVASSVG